MPTSSGASTGSTSRRLSLPDAVGTGLASTLGAGLFVALAPAAASAGDHLVWAVLLAALVMSLNAASSLTLAATDRAALGTHTHVRDRLGAPWGHLAGWAHVVGAISACAALALTIGLHVLPDGSKVIGVVAVLAALGLHLQGIERSARAERMIAVLVVLVVLIFATVLLTTPPVLADAPVDPEGSGGPLGVAAASGIVLFAFVGHLRLVNLRAETASPRTIHRAVAISLGVAIALYLLVTVALARTLGTGWVAARQAPLAEAAEISAWPWLGPALRIAAVLAAGGVLSSLVLAAAGDVATMARDRHLPAALASRHGPRQVPRRAVGVIAAFIIVSVVLVDARQAIGFASCCILVHFALVHASAWALEPGWRRRVIPSVGAIACVVMALLLPWQSVLAAVLVLLLGAIIGWVRHTTRE
ncbi:MAG: APC family permease [Janibacter sp.]|nr:APC family permease [Janibacter sp.]